ncbi:MAG: hypothetical protein J2P50_09705 [Hyphomicrobiaceae bacterium]|nr:hypothetical protein [Hyphomicrobiaceae bacterium]
MRSFRVSGLRRPLAALAAALALGTLSAGCTIVDTVDKRADFMNESVTRFRNQTILRNIIRSARDEPLSFAALSNVVGHNTAVNQYPSFPSLNWTPEGFGNRGLSSTSNQYNVSSDFTLTAIDDSATHAAILAPLDASTIAVFAQRSGWQSNLLYLLFFERIRIADPQGRVLATFYGNSIITDQGKRTCAGDLCGKPTMVAYALLAYLNLQFNLEKGALPGRTKKPRTQICFDRERPPSGKWRDLGLTPTGGRIALPVRKGKGVPDSFCDQPGTWLPAESVDSGDWNEAPTKSNGREKPATAQYVIFDARNNVWIELSTRSTWGIYQFLGGLADDLVEKNGREIRLIQPGYPNPDELVILNIVKGRSDGDCFVEVDDRDVYCVPNGPKSRLTRIYFAFLQQLAALQRSALSFQSGGSAASVRITQ